MNRHEKIMAIPMRDFWSSAPHSKWVIAPALEDRYVPPRSPRRRSVVTKLSIYALLDPRTGETKYVGRTSRTIEERLREHVTSPSSSTMIQWLKDLHPALPEVRLLALVEDPNGVKSASRIEQSFIRQEFDKGSPLVNLRKW